MQINAQHVKYVSICSIDYRYRSLIINELAVWSWNRSLNYCTYLPKPPIKSTQKHVLF